MLIVVLYVDDVIFTGNDDCLAGSFKRAMKEEFKMTNMKFVEVLIRNRSRAK